MGGPKTGNRVRSYVSCSTKMWATVLAGISIWTGCHICQPSCSLQMAGVEDEVIMGSVCVIGGDICVSDAASDEKTRLLLASKDTAKWLGVLYDNVAKRE